MRDKEHSSQDQKELGSNLSLPLPRQVALGKFLKSQVVARRIRENNAWQVLSTLRGLQ